MSEELAVTTAALPQGYEGELVARARARSPEAWAEIYRTYYRPLYRYVKARVFDEATAEDLTAAVFVEAIRGIGSYRYRGRPLLAWLYRIARNLVSSHQRRLLRERRAGPELLLGLSGRVVRRLVGRLRGEVDVELPDPAPASGGDPAALVERMDLRRALARLTPSQREVVTLRFLVGLSTEEIAELMGKHPAAVYSLQARALAALREHLE